MNKVILASALIAAASLALLASPSLSAHDRGTIHASMKP